MKENFFYTFSMKRFIEKLKQQIKSVEGYINDYTSKAKTTAIPTKSYVEWAIKLLDEGKDDIAIEKLETVTEMANPSPESCINLAITFIKRGETEKAPALLKRAIKLDSQHPRAYLAYGIYHAQKHEFDKAEYYYSISAKLDPRQHDVFLNWAISLAEQGKFMSAQEKFQKAMFYNPNNLMGLYLWASLDIDMGNFAQAREKLAAVLSFQPKNPDAMEMMSNAYYKEKNYHLAIEFGKLSLELKPKSPLLYCVLSDSYCCLNDYKNGLEIYKEADKNGIKSFELFINWGKNAFLNKDYENSIYAYKNLLKINPLSIEGKLGLAANYIVKDELDDAKTLLNEILENFPDNTYALINLYEVNRREKNYHEAAENLLKAIKADSQNTKFYYELGLAYEKAGENQKAIEAYKTMLEYDKENPEVYYHYANLILDENPKEALRKVRTAYSKNNDNLNYVRLYAKTLLANEQYKNAVDMAERGLLINADDTELMYLKVRALLNMKNYDESIKILYALPQEKKDNEEFDYLLLWAYIIRAKLTKNQSDINEMNDFSYYLSQKYSKNDEFMIKLKMLEDCKNEE